MKELLSTSRQLLWTFIAFLLFTVPQAYAEVTGHGDSGTSGSGSGGGLVNPLAQEGITNFEGFVDALLTATITIGTPIAILFLVYSGFLFIMAQGKPEKIKEAKNTFFYVIIGIIIFLASAALVKIISGTISLIKG